MGRAHDEAPTPSLRVCPPDEAARAAARAFPYDRVRRTLTSLALATGATLCPACDRGPSGPPPIPAATTSDGGVTGASLEPPILPDGGADCSADGAGDADVPRGGEAGAPVAPSDAGGGAHRGRGRSRSRGTSILGLLASDAAIVGLVPGPAPCVGCLYGVPHDPHTPPGIGRVPPTGPRPHARLGPVHAEGDLDQLEVRSLLARRRGVIRACYHRELLRHPELEGRIVMAFRISPAGRVERPTLESSTLGSEEVARCVLRELRRARFPETAGGSGTRASFAITFHRERV